MLTGVNKAVVGDQRLLISIAPALVTVSEQVVRVLRHDVTTPITVTSLPPLL